MSISTIERLHRFYEQFTLADDVLIPINADPDSIASAMAVKRLLWRRVSSVTFTHINVIKRPDNLAMIRLLRVPLTHTDNIQLEAFNCFVMVDSQPNHHIFFSKITPNVIIDHHPDTHVDAPFLDIRPKYGATASILTEYIRAAKIKPATKLATGLFHAIKTDTNNFQRQTLIEDLRAFHYLFKFINIHLARKIERAHLKMDFLKYFKKALDIKRFRRGKIFIHLGRVVNPDICVLIADFFMDIDTATWSVVSGLFQDKLVIIFRNDGLRKNAGKVAKESFGQLGTAGGHKSMARAEISTPKLKNTVDWKDEKKLMNWLIRSVEKRS